MRYIFNFPDIGEGIAEGMIIQWYVKKGQTIDEGEPLVQMETDKVVADIPSPKKGIVVKTFGSEGETVNVDEPLVELEIEGVSGEEAQKIAREKPAPKSDEDVNEPGFGVVGQIEVAGSAAHLPASEEGVKTEGKREPQRKKVLATPVARAMAKDLGVDIQQIKGTGPAGRVTKKDIESFSAHPPITTPAALPQAEVAVTPVTIEPLSQIRKTIARNMTQSKHNAAHMTVFEEVEISELVQVRQKYKKRFEEEGIKLSYLPFILKATAAALKKHPTLNSSMDLEKGQLILKNYYNIGIAVDTPEGLVVPVIKNVDRLSLKELAVKVSELAEKSRTRKLTMEDMKDGTFTITNYGAIGGIFGTPVINYPQAGILGLGRIMKTPVVKNDELAVGQVLPLSVSVDHRIVDGGEVTRFINNIMEYLSDPLSIFMD